MIRPLLYTFVLLCLGPATLIAQMETCPAIVEAALDTLDTFCEDVGRNQICYGNVSVQVEPQSGIEEYTFEQVGDIEDVSKFQTITLEGLDEENGVWGVALMSLQTSIPNTTPGQNVTFMLFGDVSITTAVEEGDDYNPMQAFYLRTGIGDAACDEAPESGMLVQTPDGIGEVSFNVNGVDVAMGSTVMFQAEEEGDMVVSTLEGSAVVEVDESLYPVVAGTRLDWQINPDFTPRTRPQLPRAYEDGRFDRLPVNHLRRPLDRPAPLPAEQVEALHTRLLNGERPCDGPGLPACDRLPRELGEEFTPPCIPDDVREGVVEALSAERPRLSELPRCGDLPDLPPRGERPNLGRPNQPIRDAIQDAREGRQQDGDPNQPATPEETPPPTREGAPPPPGDNTSSQPPNDQPPPSTGGGNLPPPRPNDSPPPTMPPPPRGNPSGPPPPPPGG